MLRGLAGGPTRLTVDFRRKCLMGAGACHPCTALDTHWTPYDLPSNTTPLRICV